MIVQAEQPALKYFILVKLQDPDLAFMGDEVRDCISEQVEECRRKNHESE